MTSSVRGPCTPSTRSSSMSLVADGPLIQVSGRPAGRRQALDRLGDQLHDLIGADHAQVVVGHQRDGPAALVGRAGQHDGPGLGDGHGGPGDHRVEGVQLSSGQIARVDRNRVRSRAAAGRVQAARRPSGGRARSRAAPTSAASIAAGHGVHGRPVVGEPLGEQVQQRRPVSSPVSRYAAAGAALRAGGSAPPSPGAALIRASTSSRAVTASRRRPDRRVPCATTGGRSPRRDRRVPGAGPGRQRRRQRGGCGRPGRARARPGSARCAAASGRRSAITHDAAAMVMASAGHPAGPAGLLDVPGAQVDQHSRDVDLHRADVVAGAAQRGRIRQRRVVLDPGELRRQHRADRAGVDRAVGVAAGPLVDRAHVQAGRAADAVQRLRGRPRRPARRCARCRAAPGGTACGPSPGVTPVHIEV